MFEKTNLEREIMITKITLIVEIGCALKIYISCDLKITNLEVFFNSL